MSTSVECVSALIGFKVRLPPELEPDLGADAGEHGRLEPGAHERFGESQDARRFRAIRLAERETVALDVAHDAGRRQLARRVDDAADDPGRVDRVHDRAVRIDGCNAAALERPAVALEVAPRDAVLHRYDHRLVVEQVMQVVHDRRDLMRFHAEDHDVVGPGFSQARGRLDARCDVIGAVGHGEPHAPGPDRFEVRTARDERDVLARGGELDTDVAADRTGADDAEFH